MFIEPNVLDRPRLSVGENDGLADKSRPGLLDGTEDRCCTEIHGRHQVFPNSDVDSGPWLDLKGAQIVTGTQQGGVPADPVTEEEGSLLLKEGRQASKRP
jgi:hypothetical protein